MRRDVTVDPEEFAEEISTHAPRVRRDCAELGVTVDPEISTHAPRVRRDPTTVFYEIESEDFYSRASCEARRFLKVWK